MDSSRLEKLLEFPNKEVRFGEDVFRASLPPLWLWQSFRDTFNATPLVDRQDKVNVFLTYDETKTGWSAYTNLGQRLQDNCAWQYFRPILIPMTRDGKQVDEGFGRDNYDGTVLSGGYLRMYAPKVRERNDGTLQYTAICHGHTETYRGGGTLYEYSDEDKELAAKNGIPTLEPYLIYELGDDDQLYLGCDSELKWIAYNGILFCWDAIVQMKVDHISRIGYAPWADKQRCFCRKEAYKGGSI